MLSQGIRILDFDGSIVKQQNILLKYPHQIINLNDLASRTRLWMDSRARRAVQERIDKTTRNSVTFLGSGDFHNTTPLLLNQFKEPISLIVFDFHPDWDTLPPHFGCGSWVSRALEEKNILKCLLIGIASEDISSPWIQSANLKSLANGRLEIYPYAHGPTTVFARAVPANISLRSEKGFLRSRIYWEELKHKNLKDFFSSLIARLPVKDVYVSIDKDCLDRRGALTNWEEGGLSLDELILMLKLIKENLNIVGLDIAGDYSKEAGLGRLKRFFSRMDHPREIIADKIHQEEITGINERANLRILEALTG